MAYSIIAQNNSTTTLADENGNVITVSSRSILDAGTTFTLVKINNNTATLEDSNGKVYRDIPCCIDLTQVTGFNVTKVNNNKATLEDGDGKVYAGVPCIVNLTGTGGGSAVIEELNVTPSTSAQTITASGGTDGYSPVNVSAVDASIDANITAGNIKSGVTILGVTGNVVELNGETKTVTPQVYGQTLYPTSPKNAITEITVNAVTSSIDANIQAGNIKKDVTILGVIGTYDAGGGGSGLVRELEIDNSGMLRNSTTATSIIDFTGVKEFDDYILHRAYFQNNSISGGVSIDAETVNIGALKEAFSDSTLNGSVHITVSNSSLSDSLTSVFSRSNITSIEIGGSFNGPKALNFAVYQCASLVSAKILPNTSFGVLDTSTACAGSMFNECTSLVNVDANGIVSIGGNSSTASAPGFHMFANCPLITTVRFGSLNMVRRNGCYKMFENDTNLASLYFPAIKTTSFGSYTNQFSSMLTGVDNCTLHFPSNVQSVIEGLTGYSATAPFGATAGSVLFDLPATYVLTGADSNTYERDPMYDTPNSLAWYDTVNGNRITPVYTAGTTDPAVSDTIYSDAACTTPVTTIDSIA